MRGLLAVTGFLPYIAVVFLNAFIDLGHKIIVQNTVFKVYDGDVQIMLTAVVNALILLPFILLFSPAGFVSDKYPKNAVMRVAAWAAVLLTLAITACYYLGWFIAAFSMTFLLAVQSAFYSPAKYGYIKTLLGKERLGEGNGAVQAVTIIAILLGTFAYSILFEYLYDASRDLDERDILQAIAPVGWMLVANSLLQLVFAYRVPELETTNRAMRFELRDYVTGAGLRDSLQPIVRQPMIRYAIGGLVMFWAISQVMLATFPAFAKDTLGQTNTVVIQGTLAASGIGIMLGSLVAGRVSRRHIEAGLIPLGAAGICLGLFFISRIESTPGHVLNFIFIGVMGGFFIVPLNALLQFHAQEQEMGQVLAANNLVQNIGMLVFLVLTVLLSYQGTNAVALLGLLVLVALIGGIYTVVKIPQTLVRSLLVVGLGRPCRIRVNGMGNIPERGPVLLLGNSIGYLDWACVQIASPRPVRFFVRGDELPRWYPGWLRDYLGIELLDPATSPLQLQASISGWLDKGAAVCLLSQLPEPMPGGIKAPVVPFYLYSINAPLAMSGSQPGHGLGRRVVVCLGDELPSHSSHSEVLARIEQLSGDCSRAG